MVLNLYTRTLTANGRAIVLTPRPTAFLVALARCAPGAVTDRLLMEAARGCDCRRTDGYPALLRTMSAVRGALLRVGMDDALVRVVCPGLVGYRLVALVRIVGEVVCDMMEAA